MATMEAGTGRAPARKEAWLKERYPRVEGLRNRAELIDAVRAWAHEPWKQPPACPWAEELLLSMERLDDPSFCDELARHAGLQNQNLEALDFFGSTTSKDHRQMFSMYSGVAPGIDPQVKIEKVACSALSTYLRLADELEDLSCPFTGQAKPFPRGWGPGLSAVMHPDFLLDDTLRREGVVLQIVLSLTSLPVLGENARELLWQSGSAAAAGGSKIERGHETMALRHLLAEHAVPAVGATMIRFVPLLDWLLTVRHNGDREASDYFRNIAKEFAWLRYVELPRLRDLSRSLLRYVFQPQLSDARLRADALPPGGLIVVQIDRSAVGRLDGGKDEERKAKRNVCCRLLDREPGRLVEALITIHEAGELRGAPAARLPAIPVVCEQAAQDCHLQGPAWGVECHPLRTYLCCLERAREMVARTGGSSGFRLDSVLPQCLVLLGSMHGDLDRTARFFCHTQEEAADAARPGCDDDDEEPVRLHLTKTMVDGEEKDVRDLLFWMRWQVVHQLVQVAACDDDLCDVSAAGVSLAMLCYNNEMFVPSHPLVTYARDGLCALRQKLNGLLGCKQTARFRAKKGTPFHRWLAGRSLEELEALAERRGYHSTDRSGTSSCTPIVDDQDTYTKNGKKRKLYRDAQDK